MRDDARLLAMLAAGACAIFALGRCEGRRDADLDWNARNITTLQHHVRAQRTQLAAAIAESDSAAETRADADAAVDAAQDTLSDVLADAHAALADSGATIATLRRTLGRTAAAAHGLSLKVDSLQAAVADEARKRLAERAASAATIAAQQKVIAAQAKQIKRLTPSPLRRLWAVTCTATFAGTGAAAGSLIPAPVAPFVGAALGVALAEGPCR